jgi:tripartite-type tricarboxylate transporter receptor subunit TctC
MFAPKGTPAPIISKLNAEFTSIVKAPEFAKQFLTTKGFVPEGDGTEHFAQFIQDDLRKAKAFVATTGVTLEQ